MILSCSRVRTTGGKLSRTIRVMKFTAFLIILICLKVNAEVQSEGINLSLTNVPLAQVFKDGKAIIIGRESAVAAPKETALANIDVTGTIKDENGEPVAGASILVKGSTVGTSSDAAGNFKLQLSQEKVVLVISSVGFQTKEVTVSKSGPVNIVLSKKEGTNEEIIVVGFGTQKKVDVT